MKMIILQVIDALRMLPIRYEHGFFFTFSKKSSVPHKKHLVNLRIANKLIENNF